MSALRHYRTNFIQVNNKKIEPIPVRNIFFDVLELPRKNFLPLLKFGSPLILVLVALFIVSAMFEEELEAVKDLSLLNYSIAITSSLIFCAVLVMAVVGCHRTFLMNSQEINQTKIIRFSIRELKFVGWWMIIAILASIVYLPFVMTLSVFGTLYDMTEGGNLFLLVVMILEIPLYYVIARVSLVLPATAIDKRNKSMLWSWRLSTGNGWRLTFLVAIVPLSVEYILSLIPSDESLIYTVATFAIWLIIGVMEVGFLSLSYAFLARHELDGNTSTNHTASI